MRIWDFKNACYEVATRCNVLFCKSFIYRKLPSSDDEIIISAQSLCVKDGMNQGLEMLFNGNYYSNALSVKMIDMSNNKVVSRDDYDKLAIGAIVYSLGHDLASSYSENPRTGMEFTFLLQEDLYYPYFEDVYEFLLGKTTGREVTRFPSLRYLETEFETEICLSEHYNEVVTDVKMNGIPMFDLFSLYNAYDGWCKIRIEKDGSGYSITTDGRGLLNNPVDCRKVMSYVGELAYAKNVWSLIKRLPREAGKNPCFEFYFSSTTVSPFSNDVRLERLRCYGTNMDELCGALAPLARLIRVPLPPSWTSYASLKKPF